MLLEVLLELCLVILRQLVDIKSTILTANIGQNLMLDIVIAPILPDCHLYGSLCGVAFALCKQLGYRRILAKAAWIECGLLNDNQKHSKDIFIQINLLNLHIWIQERCTPLKTSLTRIAHDTSY